MGFFLKPFHPLCHADCRDHFCSDSLGLHKLGLQNPLGKSQRQNNRRKQAILLIATLERKFHVVFFMGSRPSACRRFRNIECDVV